MKEPLKGLTVAITASRRAYELAHIVSTLGGTPFIAPTVGIRTENNAADEIKKFANALTAKKTVYVVILTSVGFQSLLLNAKEAGLDNKRVIEALREAKLVPRSPKVSSYLENFGLKPSLLPKESTIEAVVDLLLTQNLKNSTVAIVWHGFHLADVVEKLEALGAHVIEFSAYSYSLEPSEGGAQLLDSLKFRSVAPSEERTFELIGMMKSGLIDVITFTSPPAVLNLLEFSDLHSLRESLIFSLNNNTIVVAIGPSTKRVLEENGVAVDVVPGAFKMGPMINALAEYVTSGSCSSKVKRLKNRFYQDDILATPQRQN